MKKFKVVLITVAILAVFNIIYIVSIDNVYLEDFHDVKAVEIKKVTPFPITKEKWPEDLVWEDGMDQPVFSSPNAKKGGTWNEALGAFPATFRHVGPDSNGSFRSVLLDVEMYLTSFHPNTNRHMPGIAKEWAIGKDKKTVYYKLDPDAKWDDGEPITADDFVFALKFNRTPGIVAPWYNQYYSTMLDEVLKFDDYRIAVRVPQPVADIVYRTSMIPFPHHYYGDFRKVKKTYKISTAISYLVRDKKEIPEDLKKFDVDYKKEVAENTKAKTEIPKEPEVEIEVEDVEKDWVRKYNWKPQPRTGPYNIYSFIKGKEVVVKRNEDWWAKDKKFYKNRYNVDFIRYSIIRDSHIQFEHFLKGKLDQFALILPNYWHSKAKYLEAVDKGYMEKLWFYTDMPQPSSQMIFNMDVGDLANLDVRLGIIHSLNIQYMIDTVLRGDYIRAATFHEGYGDYTNKNIKVRKFDVQKAIQHFEKAGYTKIGDDGVRVNSKGDRLSFKLLYAAPHHTERLIVLVNEAKKSGLELTLDQFDSTAVFKAMLTNKHEIAWITWGQMERPQYRGTFHKDNAHKNQRNNLSNIDDDEISDLIDKYRVAIDTPARIKYAHAIEERAYALAPATPIYKIPYIRQAQWRWVKYPEFIATKNSEELMDKLGLFWIDEEEKKKISEAMEKDEVIYDTEKFILDERYRTGK